MQNADILALAGLRIDGRRPEEVRPLRFNIGYKDSPLADGSTYLEHGLNKVAVVVQGPHEAKRVELSSSDKGKISCSIIHAASGDERRRRKDRKTSEMESIVEQVFSSTVLLDMYSKSDIDVVVYILENEGSVICTIINAVCLALMQAGILMKNMITAVSVGKINHQLCVDLNQVEENSGDCVFPVAVNTSNCEIVHCQLNAKLSLSSLNDALQMAIQACVRIQPVIAEKMKEYMQELE